MMCVQQQDEGPTMMIRQPSREPSISGRLLDPHTNSVWKSGVAKATAAELRSSWNYRVRSNDTTSGINAIISAALRGGGYK